MFFYILNVNAANDNQREILLSCLIQIRGLQVQLLLWDHHRKRGRRHHVPCFWVLLRPEQSWFDRRYFPTTIPLDYSQQQLCLNRNTFSMLLNILCLHLKIQNMCLGDCGSGKFLTLGLYCLAHGNSYITIDPAQLLRQSKISLKRYAT